MDSGANMSLSDLQSWNCDVVDSIRDNIIYSGYTDANGVIWDSEPEDISNLNAVCTLIALGVVTGDQTWRDSSNVNHTMAPSDLVTLAGGMASFIQSVYAFSWNLKTTINAFTDIPSLQSYDINSGWPS